MKLTNQSTDYQIVFRDKDIKPLKITKEEAEHIKYLWNTKINPIEIGNYSFPYSEIKHIKHHKFKQKDKNDYKNRQKWEKEYDRQRAISEKWKKENPEEWKQAVLESVTLLKEDQKLWGNINKFNKFKKMIIEWKARQLCGLKIQVS